MADTDNKCVFVPTSDMLDGDSLIVNFPSDCGFDQAKHNSLNSALFAEKDGPVISDYKAILNRQKEAEFGAKGDAYEALSKFRTMLKALPEAKRKLYASTQKTLSDLAKVTGKSIDVCRVFLIDQGVDADIVNGIIPSIDID